MKAEQTEAPAAKTLTNNGAWGAPEGGEPSPRWHTWPREEDSQESPTATEFCFVPFLFFLPLLPSFPRSLPPLLSPSLPPLVQIWAPTLLSLSHTRPFLRREMMPSDRTPSPLEGRRVLCACGQWTCVCTCRRMHSAPLSQVRVGSRSLSGTGALKAVWLELEVGRR